MPRRCLTVSILVTLITLSSCRDAPPPAAYQVRGIVSELSEDGETIVVAHEQIGDYMAAMTMEFPLGHPDLDDGLEPGDQILFELLVDASGRATILAIEEQQPYAGAFPEFRLETPDGETVDSGILEGNVALVNFWASWCAPCREEMPLLVALHDEYGSDGLVVLGINEDPENMDAIRAQIAELDVDYPIVLGDGELEARLGGVFQIPTTFIVNRDGNVVARHIGLVAVSELRSEIEVLLFEDGVAGPEPAG